MRERICPERRPTVLPVHSDKTPCALRRCISRSVLNAPCNPAVILASGGGVLIAAILSSSGSGSQSPHKSSQVESVAGPFA